MRVLVVAACSLTLSFGAAVGINLQKLSMTKEEETKVILGRQQQRRPRPPFLQPLWCLGMIILIVDACADFVWIGLAPQSLLAPLGGLSLGFNLVLAPIFHKNEHVTRNIVTATGLIYIGTLVTVLFATDATPTYNLSKLVELGSQPPFLVYAILCVTFQVGLAYHGRKQQQQKKHGGFSMIHYCGLAGCFGGETILFAKSTSELVKAAWISGNYQDWMSSPIPYLLVVGMLGTVVTQVHLLNTGLAQFDALLVVPVYQSFWNAFGITGGLVFFQEYQYMSRNDGIMYATGILITLMGVSLLVHERHVGKNQSWSSSQHVGTTAVTTTKTVTTTPTIIQRDTKLLVYNHMGKENEEGEDISSPKHTYSEEDGAMRHRRPRTNTEELKSIL